MWPQTGPRTTPRRPHEARAPKRQRRSWELWIAGSVIALVAAAIVVVVAGQSSRPKVGDHWHASFKIVICGERLPPLPQSDGAIHTHGDDVIHIHPDSSETSGRHATIGAFLKNAAVVVTETSIRINSKTLENGDRCADGRAGHVTVLINDMPTRAFATYVPNDGDQIEIRFAP